MEASEWAQEEFGHARTAHGAQQKRLVKMAERCASNPGGRVTEVFASSAERQAAYKLLEKGRVTSTMLLEASAEAGLRRGIGSEYLFVPVDGSSLSLPDPEGERGLGSIGARARKGTGIEVMTALLVQPDGTPIGLGAQQWWVRGERPNTRKEKRSIDEKETRHWLIAMQFVIAAAARVSDAPPLWFQLDRGGDFREMLEWMSTQKHRVTVRASHDRRVQSDDESYLWASVASKKPLGSFTLDVPETRTRKARKAHITLRACPTTFVLKHRWTNKRWTVHLSTVLAREEGTTPSGEDPIEWMLHTNHNVDTSEKARLVVRGYAMRWRIEEFHRTWKTVCRIETTQLRSAPAIEKMASLMAAVAVRIERLKYLARTEPEAPASVEFSKVELRALTLLTDRRLPPRPTLAAAVHLLALAGGFTSVKSSGGPPGSVVLGRALVELDRTVAILNKIG
jgi:hypothetical protein